MNIAEQIKAVESLRGAALREKFREVTGLETRSNNRPYLIKRIVQALQAATEGVPQGPAAPAAIAPAEAAARSHPRNTASPEEKPASQESSDKRTRDPRLPPVGTVLEREYQGKTLRVKVLEDGFEFRGKTYRSLSAVAREATGTTWNGLLFFHLIPYARREKKAA